MNRVSSSAPEPLSKHGTDSNDGWCVETEAHRQNSYENNFESGEFKKIKHPQACFPAFHTEFSPSTPHLFITPPTTFHHISPLAVMRADSNGKSDQVAGGRPTSPLSSSTPTPLSALQKSPRGPTRPPPASDSTRLGRIDRHSLVKLLKDVVIVIRWHACD